MDKKCSLCGETLPITSFYQGHGRCKKCVTKINNAHRRGVKIGQAHRPRVKCDIEGHKVCKTCLKTLPLDQFYKRACDCKECSRSNTRNRYRELSSTEEGRRSIEESVRQWRLEHPDKVKAIRHKCKARRRLVEGSFTDQQWAELKAQYGNICLRCGTHESVRPLTVDHVIPILRGGLNVIDNIQPLCGSCNSSKNAKFADYRTSKDV